MRITRSKTDYKPPDPPACLSERSQELWREIVPRRARSPERLALLKEVLTIRDRLEEIRCALAAEGLVVEGGKMDHLNPLLRAEKEWSSMFVKGWKALNLEWTGMIDGSVS